MNVHDRNNNECSYASICSLNNVFHIILLTLSLHCSNCMNSVSGKRFKYTFWDRSYSHIYESIEALDKKVRQCHNICPILIL